MSRGSLVIWKHVWGRLVIGSYLLKARGPVQFTFVNARPDTRVTGNEWEKKETSNDSWPGMNNVRAWYRATARQLRNTGLSDLDTCFWQLK